MVVIYKINSCTYRIGEVTSLSFSLGKSAPEMRRNLLAKLADQSSSSLVILAYHSVGTDRAIRVDKAFVHLNLKLHYFLNVKVAPREARGNSALPSFIPWTLPYT